MTIKTAFDWAWKPDKTVRSAIKRGERKVNPPKKRPRNVEL